MCGTVGLLSGLDEKDATEIRLYASIFVTCNSAIAPPTLAKDSDVRHGMHVFDVQEIRTRSSKGSRVASL